MKRLFLLSIIALITSTNVYADEQRYNWEDDARAMCAQRIPGMLDKSFPTAFENLLKQGMEKQAKVDMVNFYKSKNVNISEADVSVDVTLKNVVNESIDPFFKEFLQESDLYISLEGSVKAGANSIRFMAGFPRAFLARTVLFTQTLGTYNDFQIEIGKKLICEKIYDLQTSSLKINYSNKNGNYLFAGELQQSSMSLKVDRSENGEIYQIFGGHTVGFSKEYVIK